MPISAKAAPALAAAWLAVAPLPSVAAGIDLVPGESLRVQFTMPSVLVGTVHDLEVVPQSMATESTDPSFVADELGRATLFLGGANLGSGVFHNFATFWLGAFADPIASTVAPAVPVSNFAALVSPGETGWFAFSVLQGDVILDPDALLIELGNGDGTYDPDNSPTIDSVAVIPEPSIVALLAALAIGMPLRPRRR